MYIMSISSYLPCLQRKLYNTGLSQPFLGMGPGPLELGKNSVISTKIGKKIQCFMKFLLSESQTNITYMILLYFQRNKAISRQNRL